MSFYSSLLNKIKKKNAKIAIVGLGYVGLPLALEFSKTNFKVVCLDIDREKIKLLNNSKSYINHISSDLLKINKKNLTFTHDFSYLKETQIIILCLPTPITSKLIPDLSHIKDALKSIKKNLVAGQIIILESSTYPGSTKKVIAEKLKEFQIGKNFFLGYSPEREDPNNKKYNIKTIPKICSGYSKKCLNITVCLYQNIIKNIIKVSNIETAEFVKLYENVYRSVNVALVNELKILSNQLNLDIYEIIKAAKTKPFGFQAFYPGPGVGGHCIPVDPYYLSWIAKKNNIKTTLIDNAGKINSYMPRWTAKKILENKMLKKVLIIGVAYKKNVDDTRESPAIDLMSILIKKGINVDYYDPYVRKLKSKKINKIYYSIKILDKKLKKYDCSVIITNHTSIDYEIIRKNSKFVVDTRNTYKIKNNNIMKV